MSRARFCALSCPPRQSPRAGSLIEHRLGADLRNRFPEPGRGRFSRLRSVTESDHAGRHFIPQRMMPLRNPQRRPGVRCSQRDLPEYRRQSTRKTQPRRAGEEAKALIEHRMGSPWRSTPIFRPHRSTTGGQWMQVQRAARAFSSDEERYARHSSSECESYGLAAVEQAGRSR
jgi:hypothetical protein